MKKELKLHAAFPIGSVLTSTNMFQKPNSWVFYIGLQIIHFLQGYVQSSDVSRNMHWLSKPSLSFN